MAMNAKQYPNAPCDDPLQTGAEFLDFVLVTLQPMGMYLQPFTSKKYQYTKGESLQGWEVKYDSRCSGPNGTGRLSIEVAEKTRANRQEWTPSGIYRSDNTWLYIQGNYTVLYIFLKHYLVSLHKTGKYEEADSFGTIKKFYLPVSHAQKYGYEILVDQSPRVLL